MIPGAVKNKVETVGAQAKTTSLTNRGWPAWLLSGALFTFYILLWETDIFTPVMKKVSNGMLDKWSLYGLLYTVAAGIGGWLYIRRNKRSRYQVIRTAVIILVQLFIAFSLPTFMKLLHTKDFYFSYLWPLKIDYFFPYFIMHYPLPFVLYSFIGSLLLFPLLAFFFGKRFYCSWICGCGGLANTFGDPWRHLSIKSRKAWKIEVVTIHTVMFIALFTTAIVLLNWGIGQHHPTFHAFAQKVQSFYFYVVTFFLSGMVGVALYPLMGTRVWCRFFCPMAAMLGLIQKIGWFQITTQGEMCIACGNCSKYCEMGIDVRAYAMKDEDFTRASCVGCGLCAHVCPRGVLKLEQVKKTML